MQGGTRSPGTAAASATGKYADGCVGESRGSTTVTSLCSTGTLSRAVTVVFADLVFLLYSLHSGRAKTAFERCAANT
jgi:hypothetical protein